MHISRLHGVTFKTTACTIAVIEEVGVVSTNASESAQLLLTRDDE
jgi:hypothetical protein